MSVRMNKKNRVQNFALALFFTLVLVPEAGIEPALPKEQDFESSASTSSATRAYLRKRIAKVIFFAYLVCVSSKKIEFIFRHKHNVLIIRHFPYSAKKASCCSNRLFVRCKVRKNRFRCFHK